jgi:hypothetical protein
MITALLVLTLVMFGASLMFLSKSIVAHRKYKKEIDGLQRLIDDNVKLSQQLFKLYSVLQDNQDLQIKAFELMSKNQKVASADLIELRDQVSHALVAIVEQMSNAGATIEMMNIKEGKIKLN